MQLDKEYERRSSQCLFECALVMCSEFGFHCGLLFFRERNAFYLCLIPQNSYFLQEWKWTYTVSALTYQTCLTLPTICLDLYAGVAALCTRLRAPCEDILIQVRLILELSKSSNALNRSYLSIPSLDKSFTFGCILSLSWNHMLSSSPFHWEVVREINIYWTRDGIIGIRLFCLYAQTSHQ